VVLDADVSIPRKIFERDAELIPAAIRISVGCVPLIQIGADDFFERGRFLILGSGLAALLQTFVPQDSLLALGSGPIMSVLFMQILAFLLSVCSTVDSFLALAFVNTFSTGAIISFLSFGPMVDIKSTLMFTGVFRRKIVFYLVLLPFVLNLLAGVLINVGLGY